MFTASKLEKLSQPIDPKRVKQRDGGRGGTLSYIEAHDAIRTANEVFGIGGWGYTVEELTHLGNEPVSKNGREGFRAGYRAVVKVTIYQADYAYITYSDVGFGDSVDYSGSTISVQELAMKEAVSDGVKRALKNLGDQFGLGLYSADGRADVDKRRALSSGNEAALKREVWRIAKEKLGKDKPTAAEVAKVFGRKAGELADPQALALILDAEGVL